MIKNLYTLKKNSWHVKTFKWIYGIDPTERWKNNFCPIFQAYFWTFIFIWAILPIKLFGKNGIKFLQWIHDYNKNAKQKKIDIFVEKCSKIFDCEEAYDIYKSKDWDKYNWNLGYDEFNRIRELARKSSRYKPNYIYETTKFQLFWNRYGDYIGFGFLMICVIVVLGILGITAYKHVDWKLFWEFIGGSIYFILYLIGCWTVGGWIGEYVDKSPRIKKFIGNGCKKLVDGISNIFSKIKHGFLIFIDMIKNIYKKNCPLVNWEE